MLKMDEFRRTDWESGIRNLLIKSYVVINYAFIAKCATVSILLAYYNHEKNKLTRISADHQAEQRALCRKLFKLLSTIGCTSRSLEYAGVTGYAIYPVITLSILLIKYTRADLIDRVYNKTGLSSFMKDPRHEMQQLARRTELLLRRLQISNRKYSSLLREFGSRSGYHCGQLHNSPSLLYTSHVFSNNLPTPILTNFCKRARFFGANRALPPSIFKEGSSSGYSQPMDAQLYLSSSICALLDHQYGHLEFLKKNQVKIRPGGRHPCWHKRILNIWLASLVVLMLIYYIISTTALTLIYNISAKARKAELEPEMRETGTGELIDLAMQYICILFLTNWSCEPHAHMFAGFIDQLYSLDHLHCRLVRFNLKLAGLREDMEEQVMKANRVGANASLVIDEFLGKHKVECDNEALEIYILFLVFGDEVITFFKQAEHSITVMFCVAITTVLVLVPFVSKETGGTFFIYITFAVISLLDTCVFPATFINQRSMMATKLGWSLIARAVSFSHCDYSGATPMMLQATTNGAHCHLISPHTLFLWRRFIEDYESLSRRFSGNILGMVRLNFNSMLELNFYTLSGIALYLTER